MAKIIFLIIIGLGVFFIGLHLVEIGLKRGVGHRLKRILELFTSNILLAIITGTLVTALIQSSSAVSVMVIGLVSGGVMTLYQGMGVIIGSNIGTTMTIHILSFKVKYIEVIFLIIGLLFIIYSKLKKRTHMSYGGVVIFGFGVIFTGLSILQLALSPLKYSPMVMKYLTEFSNQPLLATLAGLGVTALIQSSSATSGIALTLTNQGILGLRGAVGIIMGSNIGTCVTALLAAIKSSQLARKVACFHIIFNFFGVIIFLPFLDNFIGLISRFGQNPGRLLAVAHTCFNLATAILILPFVKPLEKLLRK